MGDNRCDNWSMGEPPKLSKDNFIFWKNRMIAFLNCVDSNFLTTIQDGPHVPRVLIPSIPETDDALAIPARYQDKERRDWDDDDFEKVALEHKAKYIIVMSIPDDIYHLVINCETAKEIWDSLDVFFEGTDEVRKHKGCLLVRQYEGFTSKPGESITDIYCRFVCLLNDLKQHGKVFDNADVVVKFLDSLPSEWDTESFVHEQVKNLKNMSLQTVYGNLLAQEIWKEMKKLTKKKVVVTETVRYGNK